MLEEALVTGLRHSGVDVPSASEWGRPRCSIMPKLQEDVQGGIQITGSHNPANYNGFKMVFHGPPVLRR
jgi:phosphomannomutase